MNTQSCNSPSLLNFSATQLLPIVSKKTLSVDGDAFWCERILKIKTSAIILSPASISSSSLDDFVMALSENRPPHKSGTNIIVPPGLILTKSLKVEWFL